jgi:hypothetical protein
MKFEGGVYRARVVPVPPPTGPLPLRVLINYGNGTVTGEVVDRSFKIGDAPRKLSEVRFVRWQPKGQAMLADGKTVDGAITGLNELEVRLGKDLVPLKLTSAIDVRFEVSTPGASVSWVVVARKDGREVASARDTLRVPELAFAPAPLPGPGRDGGPPAVGVPKLEGEKVVRTLPASTADAVVGGGGRYLILHLPKLRRLAVFDVTAAKIAGYVSLIDDNVKFAAGLEKLVVVYPDKRLIQRWDLTARSRELSVILPTKQKVVGVAMGSASRGPIQLSAADGVSSSEVVFVDLGSLKELPLEVVGRRLVHPFESCPVRASADGTVFATCNPNSSPSYIQAMVLEGKRVRVYGAWDSVGHVTPSADGKVLHTGRGLYTEQCKAIGKVGRDGLYCLPAAQGPYYLALKLTGWTPGKKTDAVVTLHIAGDSRPLITLPNIDLPDGINGWDRERFATDRRIHFIPDAKVLITIPTVGDRLVLHRLDVDVALKKSDVDYLFVSSRPPASATKGAVFSYQMAVKSRKGGVKYKMESGPAGMSVSATGLVRWAVPAGLAEKTVDAIVSVGDSAGQEVFHTFTLAIGP